MTVEWLLLRTEAVLSPGLQEIGVVGEYPVEVRLRIRHVGYGA